MKPVALLLVGLTIGWVASGVDWTREASGGTPASPEQVSSGSKASKRGFGNAVRSSLEGVSIWAIVEPGGGEPTLNVFFVNQSRQPLEVGETGYFLDCSVSATTADNAVSYTSLGEQLFSGRESSEGRQQYAIRVIPIGGTHYWSIALSEVFSLVSSGDYKLSLDVKYATRSSDARPQRSLSQAVSDLQFSVAP